MPGAPYISMFAVCPSGASLRSSQMSRKTLGTTEIPQPAFTGVKLPFANSEFRTVIPLVVAGVQPSL